MKLNKLASLALAGLMAVSMLAGCKDNTAGGGQGGEVEVTPSSNYTQTVMDKTNDVSKAIFTGVADSKCGGVVEHLADNMMISGIIVSRPGGATGEDGPETDEMGHAGLTVLREDGYTEKEAETLMADAVYMANCENKDEIEKLVPEKEGKKTIYTLLRASRYLTDERINNELAAYMDEIAAAVNSQLEAKGMQDECTYTVSMSKADCIVFNEANRVWDSVLVGIVWQIEYTPETFA